MRVFIFYNIFNDIKICLQTNQWILNAFIFNVLCLQLMLHLFFFLFFFVFLGGKQIQLYSFRDFGSLQNIFDHTGSLLPKTSAVLQLATWWQCCCSITLMCFLTYSRSEESATHAHKISKLFIYSQRSVQLSGHL